MDLKKLRTSVTALTLGTLLITNLGVPVFVKASGNDEKLPEMNEKVENLTTITVSGENNTGSGEITEVAEIEEEKDSITTENTEESEIIEIEEVIEDNDNSEAEIPIGSRPIQPGSGKLGKYHQGVVSGYLDAATLAKMKQVNKKTADGTECYGFITQYIENFYNKFTQTIGYMRDYTGHEGNYLYVEKDLNADGFLCEDLSSAEKLLHLLEKQVNVVFVKKDFTNDPEITEGLSLNFNTIVHKYYYNRDNINENIYAICAFFPRAYNAEKDTHITISKDLQLLYLRLKKKGYLYDGVCPHYPLDLAQFVVYSKRFKSTQRQGLLYAVCRRKFYSKLPERGTNAYSEFYDEQMRKNADELLLQDLGTTNRPENVQACEVMEERYKSCQYAKEPVFRLFADVGKYGWATMFSQEGEDLLYDDYTAIKQQTKDDLLYAMSQIEHQQFVSILHHCFDTTSNGWSWKKPEMQKRFITLLDPTFISGTSLLCAPYHTSNSDVPSLCQRGGQNLNRDFVLNLITVLKFFRLPQEYNDTFLLMCCVTVYDYLYDHNIPIDEITWLITEFNRNQLVTQDLVTELTDSQNSDSTTWEEYHQQTYQKFLGIFTENFKKYFSLLLKLYSYDYRVYTACFPKLLRSALRLLNGQN